MHKYMAHKTNKTKELVHVQTFLPYPDFEQTAKVLDNKRLGKQRVECVQITKALRGLTEGWRNHPASKMWAGHENALIEYGLAICSEWSKKGYRDHQASVLQSMWKAQPHNIRVCHFPAWLGNPDFHASHRSNLLRKDRLHYGQFGWVEPDFLPYVWPSP